MIALIKKDIDWLLFFLMVGVIVFTVVLQNEGFEDIWVLPWPKLQEFYAMLCLGGWSLGLFAAVRDDLSRTNEFLRHRPVTRSRILGTKLAGTLVVLFAWLLVPAAMMWLLEIVDGENAAIGEPAKVFHFLRFGAVAFSAFAVGLYSGTLPLSWWFRVPLGIALGIFVLLAGARVDDVFGARPQFLWWHGLYHVAVTVLLIRASFRNALPLNDPDRPLQAGTRTWGAVPAVLGIAFVGISLMALMQERIYTELWSSQPQVVVTMDGDARLVQIAHRGDERSWTWVEPDGRQGQELDEDARRGLRWIWHGRDGTYYRSIWRDFPMPDHDRGRDSLGWEAGSRLVIDRNAGHVYFLRYGNERLGISPEKRLVGKGPERLPFGAQAETVSDRWEGPLIVGDPEDGRLWSFVMGESEHFEPFDLPNGDRYVGEMRVHEENVRETLVQGERGLYRLTMEGLELATEWQDHLDRQQAQAARQPKLVVDHDVLGASVTVELPPGEVVLQHDFQLHTLAQKSTAASLVFLSALRSPTLQLISAFNAASQAPTFEAEPLVDPLVAGGQRIWLLALSLFVSGASVVLLRRYLKSLDASSRTLRFWSLVILFVGPVALLVARVVETRRAYRRPKLLAEGDFTPLLLLPRRETA